MKSQLILIADGDSKNLQILKENLEASGFLVLTVSNGKDAWEEIQRTPPKLILTETNLPDLSGYQLMERLKTDPNTSSIPVIFLTKQRDVQQRIRALEMGAKDYLVKPLHVKEVIAHIRMVLRRLEKHKIDQSETYDSFSGKLDQLSLADLIESFGVERKTGILTVSNGKRTGQVFFREGSVINARLGDFKMEQAIYQMFPWRKGYFNMIFRDVDVAEEISISNLGLLLQGIKRLEIREKLLKQLPSTDTAFIITPTFKTLLQKKKMGDGVNEFTELLDGRRDVEQIIDDSNLDDLIALKRLVRLYQQGFIKPTIEPEKTRVAERTFLAPEGKEKFIKQPEQVEEIHFEENRKTPFLEREDDDQTIASTAEKELAAEEINDFTSKQDVTTKTESEENKGDEFVPNVKPSLELRQELREQLEETTEQETESGQPPLMKEVKYENLFPLKPSNGESEGETSELNGDIEQMLSQTKEPPIKQPEEPGQFVADKAISSDETDKEEEKRETVFKEENYENYIFDVKPKNRHEDLEKEIKPIIESIERKTNLPTEEEKFKEEATSPIKEESEPIFEPPPSQQELPPEQQVSADTEAEESFIDEELIQQSAFAIKAPEEEITQPEPEEIQEETTTETVDQPIEPSLPSELKKDKVILISVDEDCKDELMDILTNDNFKSLTLPEADDLKIDLGKIHLNSHFEYKLIAVSVEKNLDLFFESIKDSVAANVFTFDCSRPDTWEFTNYLIHSITDKFNLPFIISVMNFDEQDSLNLEVIRYKLNLNTDIPLITCNETDRSSVGNLVTTITELSRQSGMNL